MILANIAQCPYTNKKKTIFFYQTLSQHGVHCFVCWNNWCDLPLSIIRMIYEVINWALKWRLTNIMEFFFERNHSKHDNNDIEWLVCSKYRYYIVGDGRRILFIPNYVIVGAILRFILLNDVICCLVALIVSAETHQITTNKARVLLNSQKIVKMKTFLLIFVIFALTVGVFKKKNLHFLYFFTFFGVFSYFIFKNLNFLTILFISLEKWQFSNDFSHFSWKNENFLTILHISLQILSFLPKFPRFSQFF